MGVVAPSAKLAPGQVLAQRYRLESLLGQGGVGTVFLATDTRLSRQVAVKSLLPEMVRVEGGIERFEREAQLAQRLHHPNTIRVLDFGRDPRGLPFIVFEVLRGRSLEEVLRDGPLAPPRVASIAEQVLKSLMEAHQNGVVHRDIKPSNIFLCDDSQGGIVKVLDFGVASIRDASGMSATSTGQVLGTPRYMAPEQVVSTRVTPATDLYALGLVMAEALAGAPVFAGDSAVRVCMEQMSERAVPIPDSVRASPLGPVIARATQKAAGARFASANEMLGVMRTACSTTQASPGVVVDPATFGPAGPSAPPGRYPVTPHAYAASFATTAQATPQLAAAPPVAAIPPKKASKLLWAVPAALLGAAALLGGLAFGLSSQADSGAQRADDGPPDGRKKGDKSRGIPGLSDDEDAFLQKNPVALTGALALGQCLRDAEWDTSGDVVEMVSDRSTAHVRVRRRGKRATVFAEFYTYAQTAAERAGALREDDEVDNVVHIVQLVLYSKGSDRLGKEAIDDLLHCEK